MKLDTIARPSYNCTLKTLTNAKMHGANALEILCYNDTAQALLPTRSRFRSNQTETVVFAGKGRAFVASRGNVCHLLRHDKK